MQEQKIFTELWNINIYMRKIFVKHSSINDKEKFILFMHDFFDVFHNISDNEKIMKDLWYFKENYFDNWLLKEILWEKFVVETNNLEELVNNLIKNFWDIKK